MKIQAFSSLVAALFLLGTGVIPSFNHYFISESLEDYENYSLKKVYGSEDGIVSGNNHTVTYVYRKNHQEDNCFTNIQQMIMVLEQKARYQTSSEHSELGAILSSLSGSLVYGMRKVG